MRGRKPVPTKLRVLHGNPRKVALPKFEPKPEGDLYYAEGRKRAWIYPRLAAAHKRRRGTGLQCQPGRGRARDRGRRSAIARGIPCRGAQIICDQLRRSGRSVEDSSQIGSCDRVGRPQLSQLVRAIQLADTAERPVGCCSILSGRRRPHGTPADRWTVCQHSRTLWCALLQDQDGSRVYNMRLVYSLTGVPLMRHAAIQYLAASPHHISRDIWGSIASLHSRCWRWKAGLSDAALRWGSRY